MRRKHIAVRRRRNVGIMDPKDKNNNAMTKFLTRLRNICRAMGNNTRSAKATDLNSLPGSSLSLDRKLDILLHLYQGIISIFKIIGVAIFTLYGVSIVTIINTNINSELITKLSICISLFVLFVVISFFFYAKKVKNLFFKIDKKDFYNKFSTINEICWVAIFVVYFAAIFFYCIIVN